MHQKHHGAHNELLAAAWLLGRGYEVYRNVSSHGPVDLIAFKNGELYKFDVKKCTRFPRHRARLTDEQKVLGVKLLAVYDDGHCEIVLVAATPTAAARVDRCKLCGNKFAKKARSRVFCSQQCSQTFHASKTRNILIATPKDF